MLLRGEYVLVRVGDSTKYSHATFLEIPEFEKKNLNNNFSVHIKMIWNLAFLQIFSNLLSHAWKNAVLFWKCEKEWFYFWLHGETLICLL